MDLDGIRERAADAPAPRAPRWPGLAAATALHALVWAGLLWSDRVGDAPAMTGEEIPVEVVEEPPKPREEPRAERQPETPEARQPEPALQEHPVAPEAPRAAPAPAPRSVATSAVPPPPPPATSATAVPPPPEPPQPALPAGPREAPPPPVREAGVTPAARKAEEQKPSAATAEFFLVPDSFEKAALPGASKEVSDEYRAVVFERLERSKITPESAKARGARGVAVVNFMLDQAGNVVTLALLRGTGDRELDAEAVALVRRAAPFPKPPAGVVLQFAPLVRFGLD